MLSFRQHLRRVRTPRAAKVVSSLAILRGQSAEKHDAPGLWTGESERGLSGAKRDPTPPSSRNSCGTEPAVRLAGYGHECELMSESHGSDSGAVDQEHSGIRSSD